MESKTEQFKAEVPMALRRVLNGNSEAAFIGMLAMHVSLISNNEFSAEEKEIILEQSTMQDIELLIEIMTQQN